ncbi:hypothetical protein [Streptomyces sp. NBC_01614]|uniref:hypothetical protein n=1 Tax=Streptomyces sp. NBC_01614 TaxID=2975897 RepID=UPI00386F7301
MESEGNSSGEELQSLTSSAVNSPDNDYNPTDPGAAESSPLPASREIRGGSRVKKANEEKKPLGIVRPELTIQLERTDKEKALRAIESAIDRMGRDVGGAVKGPENLTDVQDRQTFVRRLMKQIRKRYDGLSQGELDDIKEHAWAVLERGVNMRDVLVAEGETSMEQKANTRSKGRTTGEKAQQVAGVALILSGVSSIALGTAQTIQAIGWDTRFDNAPGRDTTLPASAGNESNPSNAVPASDPKWAEGQWFGRMAESNLASGPAFIGVGIGQIAMGVAVLRNYMGWLQKCCGDTTHQQDIDRENAQDEAKPYDTTLERTFWIKKESDQAWDAQQSKFTDLKREFGRGKKGEDAESERMLRLEQIRAELARLETVVNVLERLRMEAEYYRDEIYRRYATKHPPG